MGQAKRRKAEIDRLKREHPKGLSAIALHEAGHAVARFMTAKRMGYDRQADALMRVVIRPRETAAKFISRDGILRYSGGRTFGPWFSKEIEDTLEAANVHHDAVETSLEELRPVIAAARAAGANIDNWVYAQVIQSLAGPAAEAKAMGRPCNEVFAENEGDRDQASLVCLAAGMSPDEGSTLLRKIAAHLEAEFAKPDIWNALLLLAATFPKDGEMDGHECWMIFSNVCQADQW
jgi:hypothetical protein